MKNTISDVHNHLVAALERLGDESLSGEALAEEIRRSEAVARVSGAITANARLVIDATKGRAESDEPLALPAPVAHEAPPARARANGR